MAPATQSNSEITRLRSVDARGRVRAGVQAASHVGGCLVVRIGRAQKRGVWAPRADAKLQLLLLLAATLLGTASVSAQDPPKYFSIKLNDKLIGYAVTRHGTVQRNGVSLRQLRSKTWLKVALLGQARHTLLESETLSDPSTGKLMHYRQTNTTNDVIQHVETEFQDQTARTWIYRDGDQRGVPVETELPEGVAILGGNNFGHWELMLRSAVHHQQAGVSTVSVYLPDSQQLDRFELTRGRSREMETRQGTRRCVQWQLREANLQAWVDAGTAEFVRLELPSQQTTIDLADAMIVKQAEKSQAEELMTRHFTQSNVVFDNFLEVTHLKAEINVKVIGTGVTTAASALQTSMQRFEGRKDADHIQGLVSISSVAYDGRQAPAIAATVRDAELTSWLEAEAYIESDHPDIVAQAAELTAGSLTRWDAVLNIGKWVYDQIAYTIADTPSARLAFEKRQGDCGPHSTLMVAMLRAEGIPARLVGGLVYTPTFGGSFGQHAWVEVHMGPAGWVAVDPTTGEFQQMSATHIKLFEGLGGVLPTTINVLAFEPPNKPASPAPDVPARPLAWQLGKKYTFRYSQGQQPIGTETFSIEQVERGGQQAFHLTSDVKLTVNQASALKSTSQLLVAPNAAPISFVRDFIAGTQEIKIQCRFEEGTVQEQVSGSKNLTREIKLPSRIYCFDNNLMGCFVLICSQLRLEAGQPQTVQTFHPSSLQIIPLTLTPKAPAAIRIGSREIECFECAVDPIRNKFWISRDGRFVRAQQGNVVIELTELE